MKLNYKQILASVITILTVLTLVITVWEFAIKHSKENYAGEWNMTSEIESAELHTYIGMKIEWQLHLSQSDDKLTGTAEKMAVNAKKLNFKDRTTINLDGSLTGNTFILTFIEKGKLRETSGVFSGEFAGDKFTGTFTSSASDTKGKITGFRTK